MMHVGLCRVTPIYVHQIWFCLSAAPIVWTNNGCCFVLYAEVTKQMLMLWICTAMIAVLVQRRYDPTTQFTCLSGTSSKLTPWVVMVAFDSTTANRSIDGPRYDDITDLDRVTFDLDCWLRLWTNHVPRDGLDSRLGLYTADDLMPSQLAADMDDNLFANILNNPCHVLYKLLPSNTEHTYNLRPRRHSLSLTVKTNCNNFINRLFKDIY